MGCGSSRDSEADSRAKSENKDPTAIEKLPSKSGTQFVLIKFFDTKDKAMAPIHDAFCKFADEHTDIIFMEADAESNSQAVNELRIRNLPAFIIFRNHTEMGRYEGMDMDELKTLITTMRKSNATSSI